MGISRFEDIQAWQMARELCKIVYMLSSDDKFSRDFGLRDQTRRAAVSIMANIAEGFDTHSNAEFIQFLYYALRSASELQSHLYIISRKTKAISKRDNLQTSMIKRAW